MKKRSVFNDASIGKLQQGNTSNKNKKDGETVANIRNINKVYKKPKLFEHVLQYNNSLESFADHVRDYYPHIVKDQLWQIWNAAA